MSRADENVEVVWRGYAAFNASDIEALTHIRRVHLPRKTPAPGVACHHVRSLGGRRALEKAIVWLVLRHM